jgi:hypothetical protein
MSLNATAFKKASETLGGPITKEQLSLLRDLQGFIGYGIREGLSFNVILRMIRHDLEGLVSNEPGFLPRIKGMHAELEAMSRDPEVQREMRRVEEEFAHMDESEG